MKYPRIAQRFYCEPWMVREDWHRNAAAVLRPYLTGEAAAPQYSREEMAEMHAGGGAPKFAKPRLYDDGGIPGLEISNGFAYGAIDGVIGRHLDIMEILCAGGYDLSWLENQVQAVAERSDVHTVVYRFHTPGGLATGVPEAAQLLHDLGAVKRTVGWVDAEACSAGYFLLAACNEKYAMPSAIVGSIGTLIALMDSSRAFEMEGLKMEVFTDGTLKAMGMPGTSLTDAQREFLEERRDSVGKPFKDWVRMRCPQVPEEAMQGGWYSGQLARDLGLIDGFYNSAQDLFTALIDTETGP